MSVTFSIVTATKQGISVPFSVVTSSRGGSSTRFSINTRSTMGSVLFGVTTSSPVYSSKLFGITTIADHPYASLSDAQSPWEKAIEHNDSDITFSFKVDGVDLGEAPYQFVVNENLSAASTASLKIKDPRFEFIPDHPNSRENLMSEYPLDGNFNTSANLKASIVWGGVPFNYDYLGHSWNYSWEHQTRTPDFTWTLVDHSLKWMIDNTSSTTIRSTRNSKTTNVDSLTELANQHNVSIDLSKISLIYPVPIQNRQSSRPIDWVNELVGDGTGDEWVFVNGNTFTPFYPNKNSPTITVDFSKHVMEESVSGSWSDIYNHVVIVRALEGSAHKTPENHSQFDVTVEVDEYKQYEAVFPEPVFDVRYRVISGAKGIFSDFLYINSQDLVTQVRDARAPNSLAYGAKFSDGGPVQSIKKVRFTWGIPNGIVGLTRDYGKIVFTGTPYPTNSEWGGTQIPADDPGTAEDPLPSFRSEKTDPWSIGRFGEKRLEVPPSPVIATKEQADLVAQRTLEKVSRRHRQGEVLCKLNPKIRPGSVILEKVYIKGSTEFTRKRFVTSVEHSFSNDPAERYTRYQGTTWEGL